MLRRELVETQQDIAVLGQALGRSGIFRLIARDEFIERLVRFRPSLGFVDSVQRRLGLGLRSLGHLIQHVCRLLYPAALDLGRGPHLPHSLLEPQRPVADRQARVVLQAPGSRSSLRSRRSTPFCLRRSLPSAPESIGDHAPGVKFPFPGGFESGDRGQGRRLNRTRSTSIDNCSTFP